ncbi:MAG: hypothetical protein SCARUB_03062 [Candidatus Scalindua rubra]|uniref:Calcineurin-like phosphoesterase domain-containing protein n=1 Tax=Candidatus Scalindua rubra TaxID=1872076 RepID=A0A1E3XA21_9BACT|nr:MAG: hypothetical protein SCARUB_03062 [Candidatus Scalindua rubra]
MKIGIVADSHDNVPAIKKAVEYFNQSNVEFVIHAGDYIAPFSTIRKRCRFYCIWIYT